MKRLLVGLLVVLLLVPGVGCGETFFSFSTQVPEAVVHGADDELHLLWDIPFGITMEECRNVFMDNKGIALEDDDPGGYLYVLNQTNNQVVSFLGHEVKIEANFRISANSTAKTMSEVAEQVALDSIALNAYLPDEQNEETAFLASFYAELYKGCSSEYGQPDLTIFVVTSKSESGERREKYYKLPSLSDDSGIDTLRQALASGKDVSLGALWGNVMLSVMHNPSFQYYRTVARLTFSAQNLTESLKMENRDAYDLVVSASEDYPYVQERVDTGF